MRTLWLNFGNTAPARRHFALEAIPYPLCYSLPPAAWSESEGTLERLPGGGQGRLYADLVLELAEPIGPGHPVPTARSISGYGLCLGVGDMRCADALAISSERDQGVCLYYERWGRAHNRIGARRPLAWEGLAGGKFELEMEGARHSAALGCDVTPSVMLEFLSGFARFEAGDLIAVGSFHLALPIPRQGTQVRASVSAGAASLELTLRVGGAT